MKTKTLIARLPPDLIAREARTPLAELASSGILKTIVSRVIAHIYSATGQTGLLAYAALVVHDPGRTPTEVVLERYPDRTPTVCLAQASVSVHPIGCRDTCAVIDPGVGDWTPFEPGTVVASVYGRGAADAKRHELSWSNRDNAVGCVTLRLILCGVG
jgi:hypothetical protein